jgi:hypothetical protein
MMNKLTYFLLLILTFSCNKNDFSDTEMRFVTDKETYGVNDNFELTVMISPKNGDKKIRILKNLNNIKISFHSKAGELGFSQELKKHFIEGPSLTGDDSEYIDEYSISDSEPYKKTFKGTISENNDGIVFEIPELNIKDILEKSELLENPLVVINGNCHTVYSGIEENFELKEIRLIIK